MVDIFIDVIEVNIYIVSCKGKLFGYFEVFLIENDCMK